MGLRHSIPIAICLFFSTLSHGQVVLIASDDFPVSEVSSSAISNIYLGRTFSLPDGTDVTPLERPKYIDIKETFHRQLHSKSINQLNSYWSRLIFTGKSPPPMEVEQDEEVVRLIKQNKNFIGYIHKENLEPGVKVLMELK